MDISVEIRFASEKDCAALAAISKDSLHDAWSEKGFSGAISNPSVRVLAADSGRKPVGFCAFSIAADEAEIQSIAVDKDYRRKGIAQGLFNETLRLSRESSVTTLFLDVRDKNTIARSFYETMGMEKIAQRKNFYDNPREDGIIYRMDIDNA